MCRRFKLEPDDELEYVILKNIKVKLDKTKIIDLGYKTKAILSKDNSLKIEELSFGVPISENEFIYNAKTETVKEKDFFKDAFQNSRVVIPCSTFYEEDKNKHLKEFVFEKHRGYLAGISLKGYFVILTVKASEEVSFYHSRMPLTIEESDVEFYLSKGFLSSDFSDLKRPVFFEKEGSVQLSLF
ncbi:MAG: SOS response-associated peptidase family protein [Bacilli bacterium]